MEARELRFRGLQTTPELDFVVKPDSWIEVKRGRTGPLDFAWFPAVFPKARLAVIEAARVETNRTVGANDAAKPCSRHSHCLLAHTPTPLLGGQSPR